MGHLRWPRLHIVVSSTLWLTSPGLARDAGMPDAGGGVPDTLDAGAGDAGSASGVELVYPAPHASGVVLNPGLIVRLSRATLGSASPASAPQGFEGALLVRDDAGTLIVVQAPVALETPRPLGDGSELANPRVELATPPLALSPGRRYDVLSRLSRCPTRDGSPVACLGDAYRSIGTFTTGVEVDSRGPVIDSVAVGPSPGPCFAALTVTASDDHAPEAALRYTTAEHGLLGPRVVLLTPPASTRATLSVVPVDPSGNRGVPVEVQVEGCENWFEGDLSASPEPSARQPLAVERRSGCSIGAGRSAGSMPAAPGGAAVAGLVALTLLLGRRRA